MQNKSIEHRVFTRLNKIYETILTVLFLLAMAVGIYIMLDAYYVFQSASGDELSRYKTDVVTEDSLKQISPDAICWLTIDRTRIDYPVMQADNNVEYLNKDPFGEYSLSGSIFMDYRCDAAFTDPYTLIYGHHMAGGYMFGALDAFADKEYFSTHRTGTIQTKDKTIPFRVVAYLITTTECNEIFDTNAEVAYDAFFKANAMYYLPDEMTGQLVALTTCKDPASIDRTALILALGEPQPGQMETETQSGDTK